MDFQDKQFHVMNPVGDDRPDQQQQGFLEANILIKIGRKFDLPCVRFQKKKRSTCFYASCAFINFNWT